jgi:hypothetical protein
MKPGPNYKMSSLTKISLATSGVLDPHKRGAWKRAMIDAELCAAIVPKTIKKESRPGSNYNTTAAE